jgi:membrane-anchored protein YejM (alkaline phosphatase superfamily)
MDNVVEVEKSVKKMTASAVLKKYNLTANELDQMLSQIYETLEEQGNSEDAE